MGLLYLISIIAVIISSFGIIHTAFSIAKGTKFMGKCVDFISLQDAINSESQYFGSVFECENNGETFRTYSMSMIEYPKDTIYKLLVSDTNIQECELMSDINRGYIRNLISFAISIFIIMTLRGWYNISSERRKYNELI